MLPVSLHINDLNEQQYIDTKIPYLLLSMVTDRNNITGRLEEKTNELQTVDHVDLPNEY